MTTFKELQELSAQRAKQSIQDFGVPDDIGLADETRFWRFSATIDAISEVKFFNPTPVYVGSKLVGSANVMPVDHNKFDAYFVLLFELPERLDYENGKIPKIEVQKVLGRTALVLK